MAAEGVPTTFPLRRRQLLALGLATTAATTTCAAPPRALLSADPPVRDGWFAMNDGARLPYRVWRPAAPPRRVILALHGFDDSRDAFELSAPVLAEGGAIVYAPDQRGFGDAPDRGSWAGAERMTDDAAAMLRAAAARHPDLPVVALGESMGGAVLMRLAARGGGPPVAATILAAPAVWGRAEMDVLLRSGLWVVSHALADVAVTGGGPIHVWATDNIPALHRLSRDPLTLRSTRFEALAGLVDLMDDALAAAPLLRGPTLCLYGAHDALVPRHAMAAAWEVMPDFVRRAYYPAGYHLLLRDTRRAQPLADIAAWLDDPAAVLPSGAGLAAQMWLQDPR